jgi:hypothetical protein
MLALSGADRLLPSKSEADRLQKKLPKCKVFFFENHGHSLLLVSSRLLLTLADCIRSRVFYELKATSGTTQGTVLMILIPHSRSMVFMSHPSLSVLVSTATRAAITGFLTTSRHPRPS